MFDSAKSGKLHCSKEDHEQHLKTTYSHERKREPLASIKRLVKPTEPGIDFDISEPKLKEVIEVIRKARVGSAPGLNGIGHQLYKKAPALQR